MHDGHTHPLLQQVPLTVSPFITLPTATTLPYQYKPMPSTLPPSAAGISAATTPTTTTTTTTPSSSSDNNDPTNPSPSTPTPSPTNPNNLPKPKYVISPSGHAAHPDEILASCRALHAHVAQLQSRAERDLRELEARIRARELAEKRRVAPGWLDSEARLLEPERRPGSRGAGGGGQRGLGGVGGESAGGGGGRGGGLLDGGQGQGQGQGLGQTQWLLQQSVQHGLAGTGGGVGDGYGHGPGGASEMAVPDEGEELDRVFGSIQLGKS